MSAHRKLTPVPIPKVCIKDSFWSPKIATWRRVTLHDAFDKFERYGALTNFDRVAAAETDGHQGDPWWDGLVYEMITAAADFLAAERDENLENRIFGYVERIAAAAAADPEGYVNTAVTLGKAGFRWSDPPDPQDTRDDNYPHTVYNAGCLVEAGVHLYRATGQTELLRVAVRLANYMCSIMGPAPKQNIVPGHALPEEAFVELYTLFRDSPELKTSVRQTVAEKEYLRLAEFWIDNRGNHTGRHPTGAYNQDDKPISEQEKIVGHAVRAGLLASGVAAAAALNGNPEYTVAAERWWNNMVEARMYITGGLGAIPTHEGFGEDYELPNTGYAETCAAVAGGIFSHNLNLLTGDAKYVDVLERELYNGALSGVSLAGDAYFYTNHLSGGVDNRRRDWCGIGTPHAGTPCCPPMFLKLFGALPGYIYATNKRDVYVNLYTGSKARIDHLDLTLVQETAYPWEGDVELTLAPEKASEFALNLRIPGWCKDATLEVNGSPEGAAPVIHGYLRVERLWRSGDKVTLHLPMTPERIKADPRVEVNVGRVALTRGPIVYCFEGLDNDDRVRSLVIPDATPIVSAHVPEMLGGVTVLRGEGESIHLTEESYDASSDGTVTFEAIPFFTNSNREPTEMEVWIADDPELPRISSAAESSSRSVQSQRL